MPTEKRTLTHTLGGGADTGPIVRRRGDTGGLPQGLTLHVGQSVGDTGEVHTPRVQEETTVLVITLVLVHGRLGLPLHGPGLFVPTEDTVASPQGPDVTRRVRVVPSVGFHLKV